MNTKKVFLIVMLGAFLAASPGFSQAGDRMSRSASPEFGTWEYWMAVETGDLPSPESSTHPGKKSMNTASAEFGTWEYWEGVEAGTLLGSEVASSPSETMDVPPIRWAEPFSEQLVGGLAFRKIDLGP